MALVCDEARFARALASGELARLAGQLPNGDTPLHIACVNGWVSTVHQLIGDGAALDVENRYRQTPLDLARQGDYDTTVAALLDAGVKPLCPVPA